MSEILGGFCRDLLEELEQGIRLDPETVAARFVSCFGVSAFPTLDELTDLASRTGLGEVLEGKQMDGLRGAHIGQPGGEYHIYYRDDLWEGSKAQTLAHEIYEIILEHMGVKDSGGPPDPLVCLQAERFAVAVLMQPGVFAPCAQASGLNVVALHERFGSSYVSAALRLAEVVRHPPLMVVLYGHSEKGNPALWPAGDDLAWLRAKVVKRTRGFRARRSRLMGVGGAGCPTRTGPSRPAPWRSWPPGAVRRSTPKKTAWPSLPRPWSGRGGWPRWRWWPCPASTALRWPHLDQPGRTADNNSKTTPYHNRQKKAMPPRRKSRTITFSLPPDMYEEVQGVKDEEGRDMSELVREALRLYMEDRELRREQRPGTAALPTE